MIDTLRPILVDDPEIGLVAQVVDEYGVFAGYDVPRDDFDRLASEAGIEGREYGMLYSRTARFYSDAMRIGLLERRALRDEDAGFSEPGVIRDDQSDEGIADDMAKRIMRYPENQGEQ